jgi:hypothetical protein
LETVYPLTVIDKITYCLAVTMLPKLHENGVDSCLTTAEVQVLFRWRAGCEAAPVLSARVLDVRGLENWQILAEVVLSGETHQVLLLSLLSLSF